MSASVPSGLGSSHRASQAKYVIEILLSSGDLQVVKCGLARVILGSRPNCHIVLSGETIEEEHLEILFTESSVSVLNRSTEDIYLYPTGVFVNSAVLESAPTEHALPRIPVGEKQLWTEGATLVVGQYQLTLRTRDTRANIAQPLPTRDGVSSKPGWGKKLMRNQLVGTLLQQLLAHWRLMLLMLLGGGLIFYQLYQQIFDFLKGIFPNFLALSL